MKRKNSLLDQLLLNKYYNAILNFEEYLNTIYYKSKINKGHLINLKDYENFKEKIKYLNAISKTNDAPLSDLDKIFSIKQIEFNTSSYLINMINNDNKYILINSDLWKILCDKGEESTFIITYEIKSNNIIFQLDDKKLLIFKNEQNKNIIDKSSLISKYDNNNNEFKTIYDDIKKYYDFETKFLTDLKEKKKFNKKCNIINKYSFDKWKEYSNYENIKKECFLKKILMISII